MAELDILKNVDVTRFCSTCPVVECANNIQELLDNGLVEADDLQEQVDGANRSFGAVSNVLVGLDADQNEQHGFGLSGEADIAIGEQPWTPEEAGVAIGKIASGVANEYVRTKILECGNRVAGGHCK